MAIIDTDMLQLLPKQLLAKTKADSVFVWFEKFGLDITSTNQDVSTKGSPINLDIKTSNMENIPQSNHYQSTSLYPYVGVDENKIDDEQDSPYFPELTSNFLLNQTRVIGTEDLSTNRDTYQLPDQKQDPYHISTVPPIPVQTPKKINLNRSLSAFSPAGTSKSLLDTSSDKVISVSRTLHFTGSQLAFLYGSMALHSSGASLVALDVSSATDTQTDNKAGFWKYFDRSNTFENRQLGDTALQQAVLLGHSKAISLIEVLLVRYISIATH
jgi:hypothetical protein